MTSYDNDATDIGDYLISSRSLAEYRAMFDISAADLACRILDCPGGASSFTAEVSELGTRSTAADVVYSTPSDDLAEHVLAENDRGTAWTTATASRYVWDFYGDPEAHGRLRRDAARRFARDLQENPERYVPGALPRLGLPVDSFDLVLSSHFLFTYADRLDEDFHVEALRELARISTGEVRVFPLRDLTGARVDDLIDRVRARLREYSVDSEIRPSRFEFQRGATEMLVLVDQANSPVR